MEIGSLLSPEALDREAGRCRRLLARFAGKLRVHAAMENEALYPELLRSQDPAVRAMAEKLFSELGPVYDEFDRFEARWPSAHDIAAEPRVFVLETLELFEILRKRMSVENKTLYPLVDASHGSHP